MKKQTPVAMPVLTAGYVQSPKRAPNHLLTCTVVGVVGALIATLAPSVPAVAADPVPCVQVGTAWQIDATCIDPNYTNVVVTSEKDVTTPVQLHVVTGTIGSTAFNIYLPPKRQWKGRFFQSTYPTQPAEATDTTVAFSAASGGYTVSAAGSGGYRQEAALAKYAKTVAASYYNWNGRIYGYLYGASGGSYPTIGAMENTKGVWDGAVPIVMGTPTSIPNNFFIRAFARFILGDKAESIANAMRPGGSGNPYAGLTDIQRSVLLEVTRLGVPLSGWVAPRYILGLDTSDGLLGFGSTVKQIDRTYADDFWNAPGYLGSEDSPLGALFRSTRVVQDVAISAVERDATGAVVSVTLTGIPAAASKTTFDFSIRDSQGNLQPVAGSLDAATGVFTLGSVSATTLGLFAEGAKLHLDNSWYLALLVYHRYQTPSALDYHAWDQYRNPDGSPIYPVRSTRLGELLARSISGGAGYTGKVNGKVILVDDLVDVDAYPWDAAWYSERAKAALGSDYDNTFRLWYFENADHVGLDKTRVVPYDGFVQQALRDLSAWVEKGVPPARSTRYSVTNDTQIGVRSNDVNRGGIQPTVELTSRGSTRVTAIAGRTVDFSALAKVPPGLGKVVRVEWDFLGTGNYTAVPFGRPTSVAEARNSYAYSQPGTYYAAVRVTVERNGDAGSTFAQVQNLDRIRVVVVPKR